MPDLIVVVAGPAEPVFHPETERYFGVGVMAAQHQYHGVDGNECVGQMGQRKSPVCKQENRQGKQPWEGFQDPGEARIMRVDSRPGPKGQYDD